MTDLYDSPTPTRNISSLTTTNNRRLLFLLAALLLLVLVVSAVVVSMHPKEQGVIAQSEDTVRGNAPADKITFDQHQDDFIVTQFATSGPPSSAPEHPVRYWVPPPSVEAKKYYAQAIEYREVSYCKQITESVPYKHNCITAVAILNHSKPDCHELPYASNDWQTCLFDMYVMAARDTNSPSLCINVPESDEAACRRLAADTTYRPLELLLPNRTIDGTVSSGADTAQIIDCLPLEGQASCKPTVPWERSALYCANNGWTVHEPRAIFFHGELQVFFFRANPAHVSLMRYTKTRGAEEIDTLAYTQGQGYYFINDMNLALTEAGKLYYFNESTDSDAYNDYSMTPAPIEVDMYDIATGQISRNLAHYFGPRGKVTSYDGRYDLFINPTDTLSGQSIAGLAMHDHTTNATTSIVGQPYDGRWSVGRVSWNYTNDKIYFDNSGPVACVWEYDLTTHELRKIIPEHNAVDASYVGTSRQEAEIDDAIIYREGNCIKVATRPGKVDQ